MVDSVANYISRNNNYLNLKEWIIKRMSEQKLQQQPLEQKSQKK